MERDGELGCLHDDYDDGFWEEEMMYLPSGVTFEGSSEDVGQNPAWHYEDAYERMTNDSEPLDIRTEGWDDGGSRWKKNR